MPVRPDRVLSGRRARRMVEGGSLFVRDGAAFRMHLTGDARSSRCGRVPAHVVARLKVSPGLVSQCGDPDRLLIAAPPEVKRLKPVLLPAVLRPPESALDRLSRDGARGVRLWAAAARFRADYHLAASPGRLRTDTPRALSAARDRLQRFEDALGADRMELVESLVLDRVTPAALDHVSAAGLSGARDALVCLAEAYGLAGPDQDAGSAFASA